MSRQGSADIIAKVYIASYTFMKKTRDEEKERKQ